MYQISFLFYEHNVCLFDLESFLKAFEKKNSIKRWCFVYHSAFTEKVNNVRPHYHVWLESENRFIIDVVQFLGGTIYCNDFHGCRYTVCDSEGNLHSTLKSNFNVKVFLKL